MLSFFRSVICEKFVAQLIGRQKKGSTWLPDSKWIQHHIQSVILRVERDPEYAAE